MNEIPIDIGDDLEIVEIHGRCSGGGMWVNGTLNGHRFEALVWPAHADNPAWEIGESRVTKLWVQRLADKQTVFSWDRGATVPAKDTMAQAIADFLCEGVAVLAFGGEVGANTTNDVPSDPDDDEIDIETKTETGFETFLDAIETHAGETDVPTPDVSTYAEAGVMTMNKGLVVRFGGREYQITIVTSR